jgi:hypothetical protein
VALLSNLENCDPSTWHVQLPDINIPSLHMPLQPQHRVISTNACWAKSQHNHAAQAQRKAKHQSLQNTRGENNQAVAQYSGNHLVVNTAFSFGECLLHVSTFATTRVALLPGVEPG